MRDAALFAFLTGALAILYANAGYPLLLALISRLRPLHAVKGDIRPSVAFILPVHNEGVQAARKIENLRGLDYPPELLQVIVVSDSSTDDTVEQCLSIGGITLIELEERSGKSAALNAGLRMASGDIVAFTDAGAMLEPDALSTAIASFADPCVGCVSGEDMVVSEGGAGEGEGFYTRLDTLIRRLEGVVCSATGMSGSFYLVRRSLCPPFPLDAATDMFSALHCVDQGYRAVVEESSKVRIGAQRDAAREFTRKVRTMVTGLGAALAFPRLLNPLRQGLFSWCLLSHKILRYMTPLFAGMMFAGSIYLAFSEPLFAAFLVVTVGAICISLHQIRRKTTTHLPRVLSVLAFFGVAIAAAAVAWYSFIRGERFVTWSPTERRAF